MTAVEKFQCSDCGEIHDYEDDAHECCAPRVTSRYVCGACDEDYDDRDSAEACCAGAEDTPESYQRRMQVLEDAGQLRLPLP